MTWRWGVRATEDSWQATARSCIVVLVVPVRKSRRSGVRGLLPGGPTLPFVKIVLVRHGESEANASKVWQGQLNSPLSITGRSQAEALARRLRGRHFDMVASSDLRRAEETASALGVPVEPSPAWREMDLGAWEGRTFEEVRSTYAEHMAAIRAGEEVRFGETGETLAGFAARIRQALGEMSERLGDEGRALVVTHGGVIDVLVATLIGRQEGGRAAALASNTSLTTIGGTAERPMLESFNDAGHLGVLTGWAKRQFSEGRPMVTVVRHGVTSANREGRWQGQSCRGLDDEGRVQAGRLAEWYGSFDRVISSPLPRALETAKVIAGAAPVAEELDFQELGMGRWEGLTTDEILAGWPTLYSRIFDDGVDLRRGETGESLGEVERRVRAAFDRVHPLPGERVAVVTHGAAIKSLVGSITGRGPDIRFSVATAPNVSVTHVVLTPEGPVLADYGVATHLES